MTLQAILRRPRHIRPVPTIRDKDTAAAAGGRLPDTTIPPDLAMCPKKMREAEPARAPSAEDTIKILQQASRANRQPLKPSPLRHGRSSIGRI